MSFFNQLKRRNVLRVGAAYVVGAWLLIQVAETIFPLFGFDDTPARIVVIVLAIAFVPVLIFAWAFELTPEGLKKESEVDRTRSIAPSTGNRLDRVIMVVLALALGYFALDKFALDPARDRAREAVIAEQASNKAVLDSFADKSIAVLAFDDLSPEGDQGYFAQGIAEELLNLLARVPDLRVAGRTSAFSFKDKDVTITEIGKALSVATVLEGSVRTDGKKIRITAQLIDARSDTHLWSRTFDRDFSDIFAIQDEIAAKIVQQLHLTLFDEKQRVHSTDPQAYALFLQARSLSNDLSTDGNLEKMGVLLEQAIERDPDYADALTLYARFLWFGRQERQAGFYQIKVRQLIDRALAIEPDNAIALGWRGYLAMVVDQDMYTAARYLQQAHQNDPTNYENLWGSLHITPIFGRANLAIEFGKYMIDRDPLCYTCYLLTAEAYWNLGDLNASVALLQRGLALKPDNIQLQVTMADTLLLKGDVATALEIFESIRKPDDPGFMGELAALHDLGREEEFEARLPLFIDFHAEKWPHINAQLFAWVGDADNAFEWLDKTDKEMTWNVRRKLIHPFFVKLHDDPRWQILLEKYQMSEEQWAAIDLDLRLPK